MSRLIQLYFSIYSLPWPIGGAGGICLVCSLQGGLSFMCHPRCGVFKLDYAVRMRRPVDVWFWGYSPMLTLPIFSIKVLYIIPLYRRECYL